MNKRILYFTATYCGPCQAMKPLINELIQEGKPISRIDVDQNPSLTQQYNVTSIPTFITLDENDNVVGRHKGVTSKSAILNMLK